MKLCGETTLDCPRRPGRGAGTGASHDGLRARHALVIDTLKLLERENPRTAPPAQDLGERRPR